MSTPSTGLSTPRTLPTEDEMIKTRMFANSRELEFFLNGGIRLGFQMGNSGTPHQLYIVGKTLQFITPDEQDVTFEDSVPAKGYLTFSEFADQISSICIARQEQGTIWLLAAEMDQGVSVKKEGTANQALGLSAGSDTAGVLVGPPGSSADPEMISVSITQDNSILLLTTESL